VLNHYIAKPALRFGHDVTYKVIDRGLIEAVGPVGISNGLVNLSGWLSKLQSGQIYNYAFSIFLASTLILLGNNLSLDLDLAILLPMLYYVASNKK
jgi:NADH-ubiquinone oxidoreductase chain 5